MAKTQTKTVTRRDVFARAIEIIAKRGWAQKTFKTKSGRVCAVQAVHEAAQELGATRFRFYNYRPISLIRYNDKRGRTQYDVYLKLAALAGK